MPIRMTSNTAPPPLVASASSEVGPGFLAFHLFDDDQNFAWMGFGPPQYVQLDLGAGRGLVLSTYTIVVEDIFSVIFTPLRVIKDWTVEGSNDLITWDLLDTQVNQSGWYQAFANPTGPTRRTYGATFTGIKYRYLRMNITANQGDPGNTIFTNWEFVAQFNRMY